jgi:hypothetical protein
MLRKILFALTGIVAAGCFTLYLLTIPLLRRLPKQSRVSMDGITTLDDAVEACLRTRLQGWDLVAYAQHLTARKFTYSRLNPWDTPSRAFERGMGYCQQQALSLKKIYDGLGITARAVYALKCTFPPAVVDGMPSPGGTVPHSWLRVKIGEEEKDVCPHSLTNKPGVVDFEIHSEVRPLHPLIRPFSHLGSVMENILRDRRARRSLKRTARSPIDTKLEERVLAQPSLGILPLRG